MMVHIIAIVNNISKQDYTAFIIDSVDSICIGMAPTRPLALIKLTTQNSRRRMFAFSDKKDSLRVLLNTTILSKYIKYTATVILEKCRFFFRSKGLLQGVVTPISHFYDRGHNL